MSLKELTIKITLEVTGNEDRAINNLMTDLKNHFVGASWGEQYCSEENQSMNYAYRVNEIELEE